MHEISPEKLQQAEKNGKISGKHGKLVEALSKKLTWLNFSAEQEISLIHQCGKKSQQHAKAIQQYAKSAQKQNTDSTEEYTNAGAEHVQSYTGIYKSCKRVPKNSSTTAT